MKKSYHKWLVMLLMALTTFIAQSQTITGSVFFDGNNNGIKDATEVGYHGVTVKAYDNSNAEAASATSANLTGDYTLSGLTAGQKYRVEFTYLSPASPAPSIFGTNSGTSVQFAAAGATGVNFSIHVPSESFTDSNPRLIAGCGIGGVGLNGQPTDPSVASWLYNTNYPIDIPTQSQGDAYSQFSLYASVIHPHSEDLRANQVGIPFGLGVQPKTKLVFMSTISSPFTAVFPAAPDGSGAIYVADYSGAGGAFVQYKLFTTVANTAGTAFFGKYGLGGVDFSQDGKNLFTINLGNGKLVKIPVTGTDFASIAAGTASEITIPSTYTSCTGGTFRPTALKEYGGKLYLGAICDAGDLKATIISYDYTADVWKEELTFLASSFNAGNMIGLNVAQSAWEDPEGMIPPENLLAKFAPVLTDIAFDDRGGMMIGVTNRKVLNNNSNYETGYVLRTWRNNDGTFTLENAGVVGPLTGNPYFLAWLQTNNYGSSIGGPGGKWFFDQSMKFHPYVYNGGLFVCPGTNEVVWGASDPLSINSMGARYLSLTDGNITKGINLAGSKISRLTGMDAVVSGGAIEIGNLVWNDTNNNGRQDADETGISGVTVQLKNAGGTVVATATTDANGNYIFSSNPNLTDSPDGSRKYNLALTEATAYKICVATAQGALASKSLATANNATDQIDSDASTVGANAEISLTTGVLGENNHSYDIGFGACVKPVVSATPKTQKICEGGTASAFTASSTTTGITYQWYGPLADTTSSLGTSIAATATYTPTITATGKKYFAVIGQNGDAACSDTAFVSFEIIAKPNAGSDGNTTVCDKSTATINLADLITGEQTGGTWTRTGGTGGSFDANAGTFKPAIGATNSTFKYTVTGTAPCPDDEAVVTVTINAAPEITISGTATCAGDLLTYKVNFTAAANSVITSNKGTVTGNSVTGVPSGQTVEIYAELNGCKDTLTVTQNCSCPTVNAPVGTDKTICQGDVIPQLSVTVDAGLQADWYDAATGGTLLQANSLTYTPIAGGTFYVEAKNATSGCKSATRTMVKLNVTGRPNLTVTSTTCNANGLTFDVVVASNGSITANKGTVSGLTIQGVPAGQTVTITADIAGCPTTTTATKTCVVPCGAPDCLGVTVTKN